MDYARRWTLWLAPLIRPPIMIQFLNELRPMLEYCCLGTQYKTRIVIAHELTTEI